MSTKQLDLASLKSHVEAAMETLLRAADARIQWKLPGSTATTVASEDAAEAQPPSLYWSLAGSYRSVDPSGGDSAAVAEGESGAVQLVLHGDNTFEYAWRMRRAAPRAMEYIVEMTGAWHKPVLNRSRRGDDDQRVFLTAKKIRFQRFSNYDAENQTWKLLLRTLTRHGSDWAPVGETERGVPPINVVLTCTVDGSLESAGAAVAAQILSNSPACRVLAGLTKKVANKLGGPADVMTDKWLPPKHLRFRPFRQDQGAIKSFNPFYCLAEALLHAKRDRLPPQQNADDRERASPIVA